MLNLHAPGKLLITGEYAVLDGAAAFALPTKYGQTLCAESADTENSVIFWYANHEGKKWFSAEINYQNWQILNTDNTAAAEFIMKVFQNLRHLNSQMFSGQDYIFTTNLEFASNFGLGSSSTLMVNLARWGYVDAFELNEIVLSGSGYDIAVGISKKPILYRNVDGNRQTEAVEFNPDFKNDLIFIHLNQKQDSREGIKKYRQKEKSIKLIETVSAITNQTINCRDFGTFSKLMTDHETLISEFLGMQTVKEKFFSDCPTFVKSLGAWGGDFVMSAKFGNFKEYFSAKNFNTIFSFEDLIL